MKHIAAYLLLVLGGNEQPSVADIKSLLEAGGVETDDERCEKLVAELQGKDINELIAEGTSKLASVPSGGAASSGSAPAAASGGAAAAADAPAAEEKKEEAKEESDDDMGFGLFD